MDILISSNLERLLYFVAGPEKTACYMKQLAETGAYTVDAETKAKIDESFKGYFADEADTAATIKATMDEKGYLIDTHTAVAVSAAAQYRADSADNRPMIVASTASPYKFAADVYTSLTGEKAATDLEALDLLSAKTGTEITYPLRGIGTRTVRFENVVNADEMADAMFAYLQA